MRILPRRCLGNLSNVKTTVASLCGCRRQLRNPNAIVVERVTTATTTRCELEQHRVAVFKIVNKEGLYE